MKPFITLDFVDFWPSLVKTNNYIYNLLAKVYTIEISSNPDVVFYSVYGKKHLQYNCLKILYCAENKRPDFTGCDYALTFDLIEHPRHFRWPLYAHHIDYENAWETLTKTRTKDQCYEILKSKNKFCCMVISNGNAKDRLKFFHQLSSFKKVDSGGKYLNNIGKPVANKIQFIKDYKFVFAFENSSYGGYTTEKIIQPFITHSIPIYWGNKKINLDFNEKAFVNANYPAEQVIKQIMELDSNDQLFVEMLMEPAFNNNIIPNCCNETLVISFLQKAIDTRNAIEIVSNNVFKKHQHWINLKYNFFKKKIHRKINNI
jgi:alpha(1,3/1,4) fucosyltransferase